MTSDEEIPGGESPDIANYEVSSREGGRASQSADNDVTNTASAPRARADHSAHLRDRSVSNGKVKVRLPTLPDKTGQLFEGEKITACKRIGGSQTLEDQVARMQEHLTGTRRPRPRLPTKTVSHGVYLPREEAETNHSQASCQDVQPWARVSCDHTSLYMTVDPCIE